MQPLIGPTRAARSRLRLVLLAVLLLPALAACDVPAGSPRPSPSLVELDFTPLPSAGQSGAPSGAPGPTLVSWPIGWDVAFCALMSDAVVAQELVIDVERALAEDAVSDAAGLANELTLIAAHGAEILPGVPAWEPATESLGQVEALLALDAQTGAEYVTYFADNKRAALKRARALASEIEVALPDANAALAGLAELGVSCPGTALQLELP